MGGKGAFPSTPRIVRGVAAAFAAVFALASCGLEEYIFLSPPIVQTPSGTNFTFRNNSENVVSTECFNYGYEFYYRLYNEAAAAETDAGTISGYASNQTPDLVLQNVKNLGYKRLSQKTDTEVPLLGMADPSVDVGAITIQFPPAVEPSLFYGAITPIPVYRRPDGTSVSFRDSVDLGDADLKNTNGSTTSLYVQIYVFTFCLTNDLRGVYSNPGFLGKILLPTY